MADRQVALVTGASSGIGEATSGQLAAARLWVSGEVSGSPAHPRTPRSLTAPDEPHRASLQPASPPAAPCSPSTLRRVRYGHRGDLARSVFGGVGIGAVCGNLPRRRRAPPWVRRRAGMTPADGRHPGTGGHMRQVPQLPHIGTERHERTDRPDRRAQADDRREAASRTERRECAPREADSRSRSVRYPELPVPAVASAASSLAVPPPGRCLGVW